MCRSNTVFLTGLLYKPAATAVNMNSGTTVSSVCDTATLNFDH